MAGNLVKWWKHKILGGYKQFSVQECPTDSEELMYHHQVRASSSCSAPPDLLLVNDCENNVPLRSDFTEMFAEATPPSNKVNACPDALTNNNKKTNYHQQQKQPQQQQNQYHQQQPLQHAQVTSNNYNSNIDSGKTQKIAGGKQGPHSLENEGHGDRQQTYNSTRQAHHNHQPRSDEHIRLEEFTCDVSVEGGKSSQPLQFSFTFYDLDGHHGKITKDDIVGIVYTIYESIGKSVVVPHSGSKTINVRLTVSPEGKSKIKKQQNVTCHKEGVLTSSRRLHRYRPRKLIKSEEEDDESNSEKEREGALANQIFKPPKSSRIAKTSIDQQCCLPPQQCAEAVNHESIYEHLKKGEMVETCQECQTAAEENRNATISPARHNIPSSEQFLNKSNSNDAYMKHIASTRIKMMRKSRKQKYQDCMETRQRSLSVGSESCWNNRHLSQSVQPQSHWNGDPCVNGSEMLDSVQMRNSLRSEKLAIPQKRNSAECWKTALNRNDLISIIRESMEKNRLCFQLNGKPQANVSPIPQSSDRLQHKHIEGQSTHQRQRSNTVSKIPMLIANHSNRYSNSNNIDFNPNEHHIKRCNSSNMYHNQPHIPIYDSHMPMNPIALSPINSAHAIRSGSAPVSGHHGKTNLCGYDSFLHATICGGGLSHSPPPQASLNSQAGAGESSQHSAHQQVATVQPIVPSLNTNPKRTAKNEGLSLTTNQIRTSKILRSGPHTQVHQTTMPPTQNSPHQHGYQRLCSSNRQNLSVLNLQKSQYTSVEKMRKEQLKNYDQLLYAKLTEKLQQTNLASTNKENVQRKRHRVLRHRRSSFLVPEANKVCPPSVPLSKASDYNSFIPIGADPIECENLIVPTSDEECHSESVTSRRVAVGRLVNLDDDPGDVKTDVTSHSISNAMLDLEASQINLQHGDQVVVEEELEDELGDGEQIEMSKSGRGSAVSNGDIEDTVANANSANTSATSSQIHRYVHEHIHHHYHHFEDNDE